MTPLLSIVIPAFNEENRLHATLEAIRDYFTEQGFKIETLVVDDGSSDGTRQVAAESIALLPEMKIRLLQNDLNQGKGQSVRRGVLESQGDLILVTDADLSTPVEEFAKLLAAMQASRAQIAIGSRDLPDSDVQIRQSILRERSGKIFNLLVRKVLRIPFHDTQCGFKLFRAAACRPLFERQKVGRFSFDVEILLLARGAGLSIVEVPVIWRHDQRSRVHFVRDGSRMLFDLAKLVVRYWFGSFRRSPGVTEKEEVG